MAKKRILSGMRPTGPLHLGHYVGVLVNWVKLQHEHDCFFSVADWHALTTKWQDTASLRQDTTDTVLDWLSVGIDPDKATIFVQSAVPEIAELHLLLSMITPLPWLEGNPTVKDQVRELHMEETFSYGHLGYPVLQTSDILAVKGQMVPVGKDQLPHLEISRDIARRFNHIYGEVFPEPQPYLAEMPLLNGLDGRKMSKSYGNSIYLSDSPETIQARVKDAITDPARIKKTDPGNPEICNIYKYYQVFVPELVDLVATECRAAEIGCVADKKRFAEYMIEYLAPMRERRAHWDARPDAVREIIAEGNRKARAEAQIVLAEVREAMKLNDWSTPKPVTV
jgi:tryptophanyl-tRNA synthetase